MKTPVLFLFFKRPETTRRVFQQIRGARPEKLYLAADGPRIIGPREPSLCRESRQLVESMIDWPCEVHRLYRDSNLGCKKAVSEAINWFFSKVPEGIILEDDTVPSVSFFRFAETMLGRYRENAKVMHISGNNYQRFRVRGDGSYYASQFAHSWGWATWSRAWAEYGEDLGDFETGWNDLAGELGFSDARREWWRKSLGMTRDGKIGTWDFQWHYTIMRARGLCLLPQVNLVENIGVGTGATHFRKETNATRTRAGEMREFRPPASLEIHPEWDEFDFRHAVLNEKYPSVSLNEKNAWLRCASDHGALTRPEGVLGKLLFPVRVG